MKFSNWTIDNLIECLKSLKTAGKERLDYDCVPRCRGEIFVENGEQKEDGKMHFGLESEVGEDGSN